MAKHLKIYTQWRGVVVSMLLRTVVVVVTGWLRLILAIKKQIPKNISIMLFMRGTKLTGSSPAQLNIIP